MENFNNKGTKCPTLWLGTDKMMQNKAQTFVLELTTVRPDLDDKNVGGADDSYTEHLDPNDNSDKSDIHFCSPISIEQKLVLSQIITSLTGLLYWLH
jgi:hypothetical protein